jgi:zinc-ribbon domain
VLERYCSNCGQQLRVDEQFCPNCGRPAHETARVPTPEADVPLPPPPQAETGGDAKDIASPPPKQAEAPLPQEEHTEAPSLQQQAGVPPQGSPRAVRSLLGAIGATLLVLLVLLAWRSRDRGYSEVVFNLGRDEKAR